MLARVGAAPPCGRGPRPRWREHACATSASSGGASWPPCSGGARCRGARAGPAGRSAAAARSPS
eukprot:8311460-Pyramimonas_sp.AAC.1